MKPYQLALHIEQKHEHFICTLCNKFSSCRSKLVEHFWSEHQVACSNKEKYVCYACKKPYEAIQEMSNHLTDDHQIHDGHSCWKCGSTFSVKAFLAIHLMDNHAYTKQDAAEVLGNVTVFQDHARERFKCDVCHSILQTEKSLIRHKKQYHEKHLHDYKCDQCDFTALESAHLKRHMLKKHIKAYRFPCDQCSYVTNFMAELTVHTKLKHEGHDKQRHSCKVCGKDFIGKGLVADHMLHEHDIVYKY